jgi:hypothetical protein
MAKATVPITGMTDSKITSVRSNTVGRRKNRTILRNVPATRTLVTLSHDMSISAAKRPAA